jgi:uncharacterized protein
VEERIVYFDEPGRTNTEETLRLAKEKASRCGTRKVVIASTTGATARLAAERFAGTGVQLVVVPHQYGFTQVQRFPPELIKELEQEGHRVHFGTMLFHTDSFYGQGSPEAMAMVLRTICQGMKVCVETVLMAADGGHLVSGEEVIAVSGTGRGADTAVMAIASTSTRLHELHITEILCKPLRTKSLARGIDPHHSSRVRRREPQDQAEPGR